MKPILSANFIQRSETCLLGLLLILTIYPPHPLPSRQPSSLAFLLTRNKLNFLGWIFLKDAACLTPCSFPFSLYFSPCALCTIWKPKVKDDRMNLTLATIATFASFAVHLWSVILLWKVVLHLITCLIQRHGIFFKQQMKRWSSLSILGSRIHTPNGAGRGHHTVPFFPHPLFLFLRGKKRKKRKPQSEMGNLWPPYIGSNWAVNLQMV